MIEVAAAQARTYPAYYAELVMRAATQLHAHWPACEVEFTWWADGEDHRYLARLEWPAFATAPRVIVRDARGGFFMCQSLENEWFDIDPAAIVVDVEPDEVARYEWEQSHGCKGKPKP